MHLQTVMYNVRGKMAELEMQTRIWIGGPICIIHDPANRPQWAICRAHTQPYDQCGSFTVMGVEPATVDGLTNAIHRARLFVLV
jgi:hypothetical protein